MADPGITPWRNRIVGHAEVDPTTLLPHPANWRVHGEMQKAALTGALHEIGWIQDVIVSQRSGCLIDGHLRVALALQHQMALVPVKYVDLTEDEEKLALVTIDPISAMASADQGMLASLLQEVQSGEAGIQQLLSNLAADHGLFPDAPPSLDDLEGQYGTPEDTPDAFWKTISLKVSPETYARYTEVMATFPGTDEATRFAALLESLRDGPSC